MSVCPIKPLTPAEVALKKYETKWIIHGQINRSGFFIGFTAGEAHGSRGLVAEVIKKWRSVCRLAEVSNFLDKLEAKPDARDAVLSGLSPALYNGL